MARTDLVAATPEELATYRARYPRLQTLDIVRAIVWSGPDRRAVEAALQRADSLRDASPGA